MNLDLVLDFSKVEPICPVCGRLIRVGANTPTCARCGSPFHFRDCGAILRDVRDDDEAYCNTCLIEILTPPKESQGW